MSNSPAPGGAPAPADHGSAPVDPGVQTPNPVRADPPDAAPKAEPEPKRPEPTSRDAIARAKERVEAGERTGQKPAESKPEPKEQSKADAKPEPKQEGPNRAQDGKFAAREAEARTKAADRGDRPPAEGGSAGVRGAAEADPGAHAAAPARFSADAKAEWDRAPESVRREVARMERETTEGIERYRADAREFDSIRDFHQQVTRNGGTLHATLSEVAALERTLMDDPLRGLDMVARRVGISLADVAQRLTGEQVGEQVRQTQAQMHALHQENQRLTAIVQAMGREQQERETATANGEIQAFAATRPRFDELRGTMAGLMRQGLADTLEDAYAMADRLRPGQVTPTPSVATGSDPAPSPARPAQTRAGTASVAGAPSAGSNPGRRPPAPTVRDALRRAAATAG